MVQHPLVNEIGGQPPRAAPLSWGGRRHTRWILVACVVAIGIFLFLLYWPIPQTLSFQMGLCSSSMASVDVPWGTDLAVRWTAISGVATGIQVNQQGTVLFSSPLASGAASVGVTGYGPLSFSGENVSTPCTPGVAEVHLSLQASVLWHLVQAD